MSSQPSPQPKVIFDSFEFSPALGELRRHGRVVRLQGQPIQILESLLAEPGQLVTRESLQHRLWNGVVSGDFEHGLNAAVNKLRQALGDSAEEPRYIETMPGRGYRFNASTIQSPRPVLEILHVKPEEVPRAPRRFPLWAGALAAIVAVAAGGYWMNRGSSVPAGGLVQFEIHPPPGFYLEGAGNRQGLAVSPSGATAAFAAKDSSGMFKIFLRETGSVELREVPESAGAGMLFWATEDSLIFAARGNLRRFNRGERASQLVSNILPLATAGLLLSPDRLLLAHRFRSAIVPANGGPIEHLKAPFPWPQHLPGSEYLLYAVNDTAPWNWRVRAARFQDEPSAREILTAGSPAVYTGSRKPGLGYLLYVRGGALLAQPFDVRALQTTGEAKVILPKVYSFVPAGSADFSVSARGELLVYQTVVHRSQMIWVDRTGRRLRTASPEGISGKDARLSPDGARYASSLYDVEHGVLAVWITDAATGQSRRLVQDGLSAAPVWSPDGKRVAFARSAGSTPKLFVRSLEGQEQEQSLAAESDWQFPTDWTSDGRFILYNNVGLTLVENEGQGDIWAADLAQGGKAAPLIRTPFHEANASASPDGKWLAFTSNRSGHPELYVQRLEVQDTLKIAGEPYRVSSQGAVCLRWRRDGREIFYLAGNGQVYGAPVDLAARTPAIGAPQPLFKIGADAIAAVHSVVGFDVAADGNSFLIPAVSAAEASKLIAIQNWEELLTPAKTK